MERKNWDQIEDEINLDYYEKLKPIAEDIELEGLSERISLTISDSSLTFEDINCLRMTPALGSDV